jgi:hypothetical protein
MTAALSLNDDSAQEIRSSEQLARQLDVSGCQRGSDTAAAEVLCVVSDAIDDSQGVIELSTELPQHIGIAGAASAEREIGADDQFARMEGCHHLFDELARLERGDIRAECDRNDVLDTEIANERDAVGGRCEARRAHVRPKHLERQRLEGQRHRSQPPRPGCRYNLGEQILMSAMHAIEVPDRQDRAFVP